MSAGAGKTLLAGGLFYGRSDRVTDVTLATGVYQAGAERIGAGAVDLDTDTFHSFLLGNAHTPDFGTHNFRDDLTNEVATSGSYTNGTGFTCASVTWAENGTAEVRWDFADQAATSATITARGIAHTKWRAGASSADELVCANLFSGGADIVSTNGTFSVVYDATGVMAITV